MAGARSIAFSVSQTVPPSRLRASYHAGDESIALSAVSSLLARGLLIWLVASSSLAYAWPSALWDPFLASKPHLKLLIVVTMVAIGLMLPRNEVDTVLERWRRVIGGTAIQYAVMPLLAWGMAGLFGLQGDLYVGAILVGCVPGAMASNVLTLNAGGNASYSVSLTTTATILSPLAVPLALGLTLQAWNQESISILGKSALFMFLTVVIPVVVGHAIGRFTPRYGDTYRQVGPIIANLSILWIIAVIVAANRATLGVVPMTLLGCLLTVNLLGYASGWFGSRFLKLDEAEAKALTLEVGMQNAGLGATLASHLFPDRPQTALAAALYTFGCMLTGTILARSWGHLSRNRASSDSSARLDAE